jgi:hypothetical protein
VPCVPINLADSTKVASVTSEQAASSDLASQIFEGSSGVRSFVKAQPVITFMYPTRYLQTLYDVLVPMDKSNVRQIEATYLTSPNGLTLLTDSSGNVVRDQSPMNNPRITMSPPREGLYGFNVKILATSDSANPTGVIVIANGCQKSSKCCYMTS